jgi:hypothetical protein
VQPVPGAERRRTGRLIPGRTAAAPASTGGPSAERRGGRCLGGSYVTRAVSAGREGTYVSSPAAGRRPHRGTYVTTPAAPAAVGRYTDTHGSARA